MARRIKRVQPKKVIYVFWEGESEQAYSSFLKREFEDRASLHLHHEKVLFYGAKAYARSASFKSIIQELDEIWFFFDKELEMSEKWDEYMNCLKELKKIQGQRTSVRVRLLMTSCCIEYWLLLHFRRTAPALALPSDKERMLTELRKEEADYQKGDYASTARIASRYLEATANGAWTLERLIPEGIPSTGTNSTQNRDHWLFQNQYTFTTVHEAVQFLQDLPKLKDSLRG